MVVGAFFFARGSMDLLSGYLLRTQPVMAPHVTGPARATPARPTPDSTLFAEPAARERSVTPPVDCPVGLRLVGALQSEHAEDSLALVRAGGRTQLLHGDEETRWGIAEVQPHAVRFADPNGHTCTAVLAWAPVPADPGTSDRGARRLSPAH